MNNKMNNEMNNEAHNNMRIYIRLDNNITKDQLNWINNYCEELYQDERKSISITPSNVKGAIRIHTVFCSDNHTSTLLLFDNAKIQMIPEKIRSIS